MPAIAENLKKHSTVKTRNMKPAPMPAMAAFIKIPVGTMVKGILKEAGHEVEQIKKKNGKILEKDRFFFRLELSEDVTLFVGPKKDTKEQEFKRGTLVTLPEHGYLVSALRRTACSLGGLEFDEAKDTNLKVLEGVYFEITRSDDRVINKGEFKGTASAIYDVQYSQD